MFPRKTGSQAGGGKESERKYGEVSVRPEEEIKLVKSMINIDETLEKEIKEFILRQQLDGRTMYDVKTGKQKPINKSIWARKVLKDALDRELKKEKERLKKTTE